MRKISYKFQFDQTIQDKSDYYQKIVEVGYISADLNFKNYKIEKLNLKVYLKGIDDFILCKYFMAENTVMSINGKAFLLPKE